MRFFFVGLLSLRSSDLDLFLLLGEVFVHLGIDTFFGFHRCKLDFFAGLTTLLPVSLRFLAVPVVDDFIFDGI